MKLCELLSAIEEITLKRPPDEAYEIEVSSVSSDSRECGQGALFVCLCGARYDGHDHIKEALLSGAAAVVCEYETDELIRSGVPYAVVSNTRRAVSYLHARAHGDPQDELVIVGVTGTNGKSSTVTMLDAIFRSVGVKSAIIGTIPTPEETPLPGALHVGTMTTPDPDTLFATLRRMADEGVTHVFMEVSSHALELERTAPISFEAAVFTNLTQDHLDFHGTMEAYFLAKVKLFDRTKHAVINLDDEYGRRLYGMIDCQRTGYSTVGIGDHYASDIRCDSPYGICYRFCGKYEITSPIPGSFTVYNSLAAISCALVLGIPVSVSREAVASLAGVKGRIEPVRLPEGAAIDVFIDYAHTPDALLKLLTSVRGFAMGRRIVLIMGCGGDRDRSKRPIMGEIASRYSDLAVITSDNSRSESPSDIIADILRGVDRDHPYIVIESRAAAIRYAVTTARRGDIVLIAGKGHEEYEITADGMHPFSERDRVLAAYAERRDAGKN